jgi:ornithine cyclodeaminase/alanine dehydrogenase
MTLLLNRRDLEQVLDWPSVIAAVERGFVDMSAGRVQQPARTVMRSTHMPGVYVLMPCVVDASRVLGTKFATIYPTNPQRGLPTISAVYALTDFETGQLISVMDAAYMTGVRTAAATVVATQALARSDAATLGLFGTGTQAEFHARAFAAAMPQLKMRVVGTTPEKTRGFAERLAKSGVAVEPAASARAAAQCDVVVAATSATQPVFDGTAIRPGAHVNGIGSHMPKIRELDTETVARSRVIADSYDALFAESGDVLIPIEEGRIGKEHVVAELGEVLGKTKRGRTLPNDITLFKSNGVAFQDVVTASIAYQRAREVKLGTEFDFNA